MPGFIPLLLSMPTRAISKGVLPVPPTAILPTTITGTDNLDESLWRLYFLRRKVLANWNKRDKGHNKINHRALLYQAVSRKLMRNWPCHSP